MFEKYTSAFSATALRSPTASTEGILRQEVNRGEQYEGGAGVAPGLDIGAVAITDRENCWLLPVLATITIYRAKPISSGWLYAESGETGGGLCRWQRSAVSLFATPAV